MFCIKCGAYNLDGSMFCSKCGYSFEKCNDSPEDAVEIQENQNDDILDTYCCKCGSKMDESDIFCPKCGTEVSYTKPIVDKIKTTKINLKFFKKKPIILVSISLIIIATIITAIVVANGMNSTEKLIYSNLVANINDFYNPKEIRIIDCGDIEINDDGEEAINIQIQGTNKVGGTISHVYRMHLTGEYAGDMYTLSELYEALGSDTDKEYEISSTNTSVDVSKINEAIIKYCEEQGL